MHSLSDQQLLRDYSRCRSEEAFAELVHRHLDMVYSAALRMTRDQHLAEDVTQGAFLALARNAKQLAERPTIFGWLHHTARNLAVKNIRTEVRRRAREQEALAMNQLVPAESNTTWEQIAAHLDDALANLSHDDRDAVLMRYFQRKSARDMAGTLRISDEAAQKRVARAVERLREFLAKRGVTIGATGLAVIISANAVQAAPVGLAATICTGATLAGTTVASTITGATTKAIAMTTLQKALVTIAVAGFITTLVIQHRSQVELDEKNRYLRNQLAQLQMDNETLSNRLAPSNRALVQKLPAPTARSNKSGPAAADELASTNLYTRLKDNSAKLMPGQLESYLATNRRSAASLLAAYRTTGEPALLDEAMKNYPDDPQVGFEGIFKKETSPEERRQWLEALKKSAPDNALANYLSALDYFKAGQRDQAMQELIAASSKPQFRDYTLDRMQDDEEAYLAAGYSMAEAKTIPSWQLLLPQLGQIKDLSRQMIDLADSYRAGGDQISAQGTLQMVADLGRRYGNTLVGETEISRLVGMAVERNALNAMDPNSPYGDGEQTVRDRLDYLAQQSSELKSIAQQTEALLPMMSDQDWISYKDRWRVFGEEAAGKWLISKYGQK